MGLLKNAKKRDAQFNKCPSFCVIFNFQMLPWKWKLLLFIFLSVKIFLFFTSPWESKRKSLHSLLQIEPNALKCQTILFCLLFENLELVIAEFFQKVKATKRNILISMRSLKLKLSLENIKFFNSFSSRFQFFWMESLAASTDHMNLIRFNSY